VSKLITPMRAADLEGDVSKLKYPLWASPKLDGYRATVQLNEFLDPCLLSKNNKPIRNIFTQALFGDVNLVGLDGELVVGDVRNDPLQRTSSGVTAAKGEPDVRFYVFDDFSYPADNLPFEQRLDNLLARRTRLPARVVIVQQVLVKSEAELLKLEAKWLDEGYEGVMTRSPNGPYKQGGAEPRATVAEGYCSKLKRRQDAEARIIGYTEQTENTNEATKDELGRTKRSSAKAGKVGKGVLGSLQVVGVNGRWKGVEFDIGNGWTAKQRADLWAVRKTLLDRIVKFKHGKTPKTFDKPQFPIFADFRGAEDM